MLNGRKSYDEISVATGLTSAELDDLMRTDESVVCVLK